MYRNSFISFHGVQELMHLQNRVFSFHLPYNVRNQNINDISLIIRNYLPSFIIPGSFYFRFNFFQKRIKYFICREKYIVAIGKQELLLSMHITLKNTLFHIFP